MPVVVTGKVIVPATPADNVPDAVPTVTDFGTAAAPMVSVATLLCVPSTVILK